MTNPYPHYKPSGIDWLGNIPAHWEVKKLKYLVQSVKNDTAEGTLRIAVENMESRTGRLVNLSDETTIQSSATGFRPGDVIFNKLRPYLAKVYYAEELGGCFGELLVLRSKGELDGRYTFYRLLSDEFISKVDSSTEGTKMPRANYDEFIAHLKLPYPPLAEQTAIADYLDQQTAHIDELLAQKRELVSLLQEERAGLINDAVTQGLHHRVPRKDSGLPWLGQIPAHWEVKKLAHGFSDIGSGTTPASGQQEYYMNGDINWLQTGDLTDSYVYETSKKITQKAFTDYSTLRVYPVGSVVMAMYGATIGRAGLLTIETTTNQACCVLPKSQAFNGKYVFYWILSSRDHILSLSSGGGQPNINQETVKSLRLPYPPLAEQAEIVAYLDTETERIDATVQTVEQEIGLLTEYRSALISEVVTGKQKVS